MINSTYKLFVSRYVAEHSRANIMVVEDAEQYAKVSSFYTGVYILIKIVFGGGNTGSVGLG